MAQRGPRAQPTPGRTHPQTRGSCLSLLGRPQAPVSVGPLAPHPRRGHGSDPGRAPSPFRVPPARTRPRSRAGFGAAAGSGRRRRQVARPGPAPRPAPTIAPPPPCAPGSGSGPRCCCCGDCSRRRRQRGRPWRRAPRPAREPRAGAAQVRAPLPHLSTAAPSSSPSFLPADPHVFPPSAAPTFPSQVFLPPSRPSPRAWSPSFPLGLPPPAASCLAVLSLSPLRITSVQPRGAPDPAPPPARKASERGARVGRAGSRQSMEGRGAALAQTPSHGASCPPPPASPSAHHLPLPAAPLAAPARSPILPPLLLSPLGLRDTHPFRLCKAEEPCTGGAEEAGQRRARSPQAQLEGRLREQSRRAGQSEPSTLRRD